MALDFFAGCVGGCAGVLVGHPFDTVKVNLQTQDHLRPMYRGTFHCLKTIIAKESFRGLYKGVTSPMAGVAFVNAIVFGVYGNIQRHMQHPTSLYTHFLAGTAAGLAQSVVCSPMELVKTRIQLQDSIKTATHYKGPMDCLNTIWRKEGFRGVFRGYGITAMRDMPGFSSYFVAYEVLEGLSPNPGPIHTLLAGGVAGTFSWLVTFPIDVVKSRLQMDGISGPPQYKGIVDCVRQSYKVEGYQFFCRGLNSTLIRAFPMNAVCFLVVSTILKVCHSTQVEVYYPETIEVVGSISTPLIRTHKYDSPRHRSMTINGLLFCGAFSEAVCSSEILELANDLYDDHYDNKTYFNMDATNMLKHSIEEASSTTGGDLPHTK